jgi:hypothetical protein
MTAARYDIYIEQGANFNLLLNLDQDDGNAFNLAGYTPKAQLREEYDSAAFTEITCEIMSEEDGIIKMSLTAEQTAALTENKYLYDLILKDTTGVVRLLDGRASVAQDVTREEEIIP